MGRALWPRYPMSRQECFQSFVSEVCVKQVYREYNFSFKLFYKIMVVFIHSLYFKSSLLILLCTLLSHITPQEHRQYGHSPGRSANAGHTRQAATSTPGQGGRKQLHGLSSIIVSLAIIYKIWSPMLSSKYLIF